MSAISLILLLAAAVATVLGGAALHTARGLRRQLTELRVQLAAAEARGALAHAFVPAPRTAPDADEIRSAVADALAEERERELAEARAFWAAQEARDARADQVLLEGRGAEYEGAGLDSALLDALLERTLGGVHEGELFVPRPSDRDLPRTAAPRETGAEAGGAPGAAGEPGTGAPGEAPPADPARGAEGTADDSPELAAARRRHPSQSGYDLRGEPVAPAPPPADHEETHRRLSELAESRIPLTDVRPGPLGTLDVYVFADGTTVCMTPGHRETAERLAAALRAGTAPVLLGGSGVSGAYTLTFECGRESVYVLADRIIASL
ncbi:hypothetical protein [Streptomyces sp. URMC 125]|uniref:hypothetical protein n=1 Tax=Streptomyces sp. URMC 125 TaxID=3423419 RepID=UPI003F1D6558